MIMKLSNVYVTAEIYNWQVLIKVTDMNGHGNNQNNTDISKMNNSLFPLINPEEQDQNAN